MEEARGAGKGAEEVEDPRLRELYDLLAAMDILQDTFSKLASPEELKEAEGRRCVLAITGVNEVLYFEVSGSRVRRVAPYEKPDTYIIAPIESVIRVLKGVLDGREDAFSMELARGEARILGKRYLHDGWAFSEAFKRIARLIRRYKAAR